MGQCLHVNSQSEGKICVTFTPKLKRMTFLHIEQVTPITKMISLLLKWLNQNMFEDKMQFIEETQENLTDFVS